MKFGKFIQTHSIPEWSSQYVNYKYLKKIINSTNGTSANLSLDINAAKHEFLTRLQSERDQVNHFYTRKETELKSRLQSLKDKINIIVKRRGRQYGNVTVKSLRFALADFVNEFDKLQKYVEMNDTGFKKIIKKWDKYSKSVSREISLTNQIEIELCFNYATMSELSDCAAACLDDLHSLDSDDSVFDEDKLGSDYEFGGDDHLETQFTLILIQAKSPNDERISHFLTLNYHLATSEYFALQIMFCLCSRADVTVSAVDSLLSLDIARGANVDFNYKDSSTEKTCLHVLSENGNLALIKYLVEKGADPNIKDLNERLPLHYAAMGGHYNCINYFLSRDTSNINAHDRNGMTPLLCSVGKSHVASSKLLIEHGASILEPESALLKAIDVGNADMVDMLFSGVMIGKGKLLAKCSQTGLFPIHAACQRGSVDIVNVLLTNSEDKELERFDMYNNWTPLFYAVCEDKIECVRFLLERHALPSLTDESGWSVLDYASWYGNSEILKLLRSVPQSTDYPKSVPVIGLDDIPPMSLPPPSIPLFGRKYIGFNTELQLRFGHFIGKDRKKPGIQIFDAGLNSFKVVMTQRALNSKQDSGVESSISTVQPSQEDKEVFKFVGDYSGQGSVIEFEIFHTFGRNILGKSVMLSRETQNTQIFSVGSYILGVNGIQHLSLPIIDKKLAVVGLLNVELFTSFPVPGLDNFPSKDHSSRNVACADFAIHSIFSSLGDYPGDFISALMPTFERLKAGDGIMLNLAFPYFCTRDQTSNFNISEYVDGVLKAIFEVYQTCAFQWNLILASGNPIVCQLLSLKQPAFPVMFNAYTGEPQFSPYEASKFASSAGIFGVILDESQVVEFPNIVKAIKDKSLVLSINSKSTPVERIRKSDLDGYILGGDCYHHFNNIFS